MKDQVTSIEQSKRLIELGVPAERASMVWLAPMDTNEYCLTSKLGYCCPDEQDIPAFTVADLLGMIKPIDIGPDTCDPCLEKMGNEGDWRFEFGQILGDEDFGYGSNHNLINLLADRIEWIVSNGYGLNL